MFSDKDRLKIGIDLLEFLDVKVFGTPFSHKHMEPTDDDETNARALHELRVAVGQRIGALLGFDSVLSVKSFDQLYHISHVAEDPKRALEAITQMIVMLMKQQEVGLLELGSGFEDFDDDEDEDTVLAEKTEDEDDRTR